MQYRIHDLEIPADDPFRHDALKRRPLVEFLASLLSRTNGPFVLALDSPWGSGKTTLIKMLMAVLENQGAKCVYFNAWQVDYVTDPLVALVSSIDRMDLGGGEAEAAFKSGLKTVRKVTSLVAKRGLVAATKVFTGGLLNLDAEFEATASEFAGDAIGDIVGAFQRETDLIATFREELKNAVDHLQAAGKKSTLVFFIDELDRCRPTFAIELLERIKHLFDVPNIAFVLSVDKQQLEASTAAVYGERIKSAEYLRRFIDLEYGIPAADTESFTISLMARFGIDEIFDSRSRKHSEHRYDRDNFVKTFTKLSDILRLSLRARERCITRLCAVLDQTQDNEFLDPILVALLVVLRSNNPEMFHQLVGGYAPPHTVMEYITSLPGGSAMYSDRSGVVMERYLMAADPVRGRTAGRDEDLSRIVADAGSPPNEKAHAVELLRLREHIPGAMRFEISLGAIAKKIDLAAWLRD